MAEPGAARGRIAVAQVGHTGTDGDRDRWLAAGIWLERADPALYRLMWQGDGEGSVVQDAIDLNGSPRRDFLGEDQRYDVVVIHNLWSPPAGLEPETSGGAAISPRHSPAGWRHRLQLSCARYILIFGRDFTAYDLDADIPGYSCFDVPANPPLSVFVRLPCPLAPELLSRPIGYRDMTAAQLRRLAELRLNASLDLSYTAVGGEQLAQLKEMPALADLRLVGTGLSDQDARHLAEIGALRRLNLDSTGLSNAALVPLRRLRRLECLSLNHTKIDDDGLRHLRGQRMLKWLSLIDTAVSDTGLAQLSRLDQLESLCLVGTGVSAAGVARLRAALPGCAIDH
jgi:hypothetical protein